jgi:hypothetical protein
VATKIGSNSASITWAPSGETPVAPIRWYVVKAVSSDPAVSSFRYTTNGLTNETSLFATGFNQYSYQFSIQSVNCPGYGPAALTNSINFAPAGAGGSWAFGEYFTSQILNTTTTFAFTPGLGSYTMEFFIYPDDYQDANSNIQMNFAQKFRFIQGAGKGGGTKAIILPDDTQLDYSNFLTLKQWYHFAISRDGSTSNAALWLNGTRQSLITDSNNYSGANTAFVSAFASFNSNFYLTNLNFMQGAYKYNPANTTITVPTSPITSNANTEGLWLATTSNTAFDDSGPIGYVLDLTNANGIVWASNSPF